MQTYDFPRRGVPPLLLLVLILAVVFAAMRVTGMFGPASLRWLAPLGFVLMALAPWALLDRAERRAIGLRRPDGPGWAGCSGPVFGAALLAGAAAALACGVLGVLLFGAGADNWYVSVANFYRGTLDTSALDRATLYLVFTVPALVFSPLGEEIFFRGLLQNALEQRFSARTATLLECAAFGVVHLCHHGLVVETADAGGVGGAAIAAEVAGLPQIGVRPLSAALWVGLMFLVALLFAQIRKRSGSLYPAIAAHAAFNAAMNAVIFGYLWSR